MTLRPRKHRLDPAARRSRWLLSFAGGVLVLCLGALGWVLLTTVSHASEDCSTTGGCSTVQEAPEIGRATRGTFEGRVTRGAGDSAFVASRRGSVYYPRECEAWSSLAPANLVWFGDEEGARAAGYRRTASSRCVWEAEHPAAAGGDSPAASLESVCTVSRIVDGDTLACREGGERIRLLLVDAPELSQGEYGRIAAATLAELLPVGAEARVERDVQERDRYRRLLAYLYDSEGRMINEELARRGVVTVSIYPPNVRHVERIRAAVAAARGEGRGLWSGSAFDCTPADHRAGRCG